MLLGMLWSRPRMESSVLLRTNSSQIFVTQTPRVRRPRSPWKSSSCSCLSSQSPCRTDCYSDSSFLFHSAPHHLPPPLALRLWFLPGSHEVHHHRQHCRCLASRPRPDHPFSLSLAAWGWLLWVAPLPVSRWSFECLHLQGLCMSLQSKQTCCLSPFVPRWWSLHRIVQSRFWSLPSWNLNPQPKEARNSKCVRIKGWKLKPSIPMKIHIWERQQETMSVISPFHTRKIDEKVMVVRVLRPARRRIQLLDHPVTPGASLLKSALLASDKVCHTKSAIQRRGTSTVSEISTTGAVQCLIGSFLWISYSWLRVFYTFCRRMRGDKSEALLVTGSNYSKLPVEWDVLWKHGWELWREAKWLSILCFPSVSRQRTSFKKYSFFLKKFCIHCRIWGSLMDGIVSLVTLHICFADLYHVLIRDCGATCSSNSYKRLTRGC